jgi:hypothetical protein
MAQRSASRRGRPAAQSLSQAMREFLTPQVFKQVRQADRRRKQPRWDLHPLLYVLLLMTWCCGDSLPEQFEAARSYYVVICSKRRRPGTSFGGFEQALSRLPTPVLRRLAAALRARLAQRLGSRMFCRSFIPLGCDGTRLECPRTSELERRLGCASKAGSAPTLWNVAIVLLTVGVPWCWRLGCGDKTGERAHLVKMLPLLPQAALLIADAGYVGFDLIETLLRQKVSFLIRMSSNATFYVNGSPQRRLEGFREGWVLYWPQKAQKQRRRPLWGRLIRLRPRGAKHEVWLFTNVGAERLSRDTASLFYRWRWGNEGLFRTYKRTLKKLKLSGRTVRVVHREAEVSMLATQLLLCQGVLALPQRPPRSSAKSGPLREPARGMCSPRKVLLEIRREIRGAKCQGSFGERLRRATLERRARTTPKEKREWPRRKRHKPPRPPVLLRLPKELKMLMQQLLQAA